MNSIALNDCLNRMWQQGFTEVGRDHPRQVEKVFSQHQKLKKNFLKTFPDISNAQELTFLNYFSIFNG